jgi:short subunit dehydrogenase-like uncharacterized protein
MKKTKPVYGRSQGAKLQNSSRESTTKNKHAKSGSFNHRISFNKSRSNKVSIKSLPRTIVQLGIVMAIGHWLVKNTPVGQSTAQNITERLSTTAKDASKMKERIDPTNLSQQRQQKSDKHFDDAWKKACGNDKDCQ